MGLGFPVTGKNSPEIPLDITLEATLSLITGAVSLGHLSAPHPSSPHPAFHGQCWILELAFEEPQGGDLLLTAWLGLVSPEISEQSLVLGFVLLLHQNWPRTRP